MLSNMRIGANEILPGICTIRMHRPRLHPGPDLETTVKRATRRSVTVRVCNQEHPALLSASSIVRTLNNVRTLSNASTLNNVSTAAYATTNGNRRLVQGSCLQKGTLSLFVEDDRLRVGCCL